MQPMTRSHADAVLIRVFQLGKYVVRGPNVAILLLQCIFRYDISMSRKWLALQKQIDVTHSAGCAMQILGEGGSGAVK